MPFTIAWLATAAGRSTAGRMMYTLGLIEMSTLECVNNLTTRAYGRNYQTNVPYRILVHIFLQRSANLFVRIPVFIKPAFIGVQECLPYIGSYEGIQINRAQMDEGLFLRQLDRYPVVRDRTWVGRIAQHTNKSSSRRITVPSSSPTVDSAPTTAANLPVCKDFWSGIDLLLEKELPAGKQRAAMKLLEEQHRRWLGSLNYDDCEQLAGIILDIAKELPKEPRE
jgi:hypothetical protein